MTLPSLRLVQILSISKTVSEGASGSARLLLLLVAFPIAAAAVFPATSIAEDKPAEVTIELITEGRGHHEEASVYTLNESGGWFRDLEGRHVHEKNFADIVRLRSDNKSGTHYVVIMLEDEKIPFEKVVKRLDQLRRLAEPNTKVVIYVFYNPPGKAEDKKSDSKTSPP